MIDLDFVRSLIKSIEESDIHSIEIEHDGTRIKLSKTPPGGPNTGVAVAGHLAPAAILPGALEAPSPAADSDPEVTGVISSALIEIKSPMVGTFFRAPAPEAPVYVEVGSRVGVGDSLCIIEAMKLMNELECEVSGVIQEICVQNADPVEYGQVLFRVSA
jgi:acetyl-CoA carboxylase biotin carboxyl carrier protein